MSPRMLLLYTSRAVLFAAGAAVLCAAGRVWFLRSRKTGWSRRDTLLLLLVFFLAALLEITVIRGGPDWDVLRTGAAVRQVILVPFRSAYELYRDGLWYFCVEVLGNTAAFIPFGVLLPLCFPRFGRIRRILAASAGLSLCIELAQYALATGVADVDDLLLNTLGGLTGFGLVRLTRKVRRKRETSV